LQLTNFWQDVRRDLLDRDRIYIPKFTMTQFGVTEDQIKQGRCDDCYRALIRHEVERTERLFLAGDALVPLLDKKFQKQIALFSRGGRAILQAIRRRNYDTLTKRPKLTLLRKSRLALGMVFGSPSARTK
jgi:phytoene/squalene synthetase